MRNRVLATTALAATFAGSLFIAEASFAGSTSTTTAGTGGGATAAGSATTGAGGAATTGTAGTTATGRATTGGGATATVSTGASTQQRPNEMRARRLMGSDIYNPNNEDIGEIEDLVFDEKGQISSVIVSVGGFLGIGEKWVAVPWNSVQWRADDRGNRRASMNMTRDQLKEAPAFQTAEEIRRDNDAMRARMDAGGTAPGGRAAGGGAATGTTGVTTGTTGGAATGTTGGATGGTTTAPRQ